VYLAAGSEWVLLLGPVVGSPGPVFVDLECVAAVVVASGSTAVGKPAVYSPTAAAVNERQREGERERGMLNKQQNKEMGKVGGRDLESSRIERAVKRRHSLVFISLQPRPGHV